MFFADSLRCNSDPSIGKLSLKLVERRGFLRYKARVVYFVYNTILWASEPIQMLVEAHLLGYKTGQLCGDIHYSLCNLMTAMLSGYVVGQHLDTFRKHILEFISKLQFHGMKICFNFPLLLLSQVSVLKEGLHMSSVSHVDNMPCEGEILADARAGLAVYAHGKLHHLARAYLFRKLEDATLNIDISGAIAESHHQLDPVFLFGYLFEGLTSFLLARQTSDSVESAKWIERGHAVMTKIRFWNEHSSWNWENKMLLLDAEHMFTIGEHDKAEPLYRCAIRSSREHKFVHEEAIASEHAGTFYYERGLHQTSYSCFVHSMKCFEKWGAYAVATRVGNVIKGYFGRNDNIDLLESSVDAQLEYLFASSPTQGSEKKRQHGM